MSMSAHAGRPRPESRPQPRGRPLQQLGGCYGRRGPEVGRGPRCIGAAPRLSCSPGFGRGPCGSPWSRKKVQFGWCYGHSPAAGVVPASRRRGRSPRAPPPRGGAAISSQHRSAGSDDTMADEPPLGPIMNHAARCGGVVPAIDRRSCSPIRRLLTGDCCETSGWLHGCTSHMQPVEACLPAGDRLMAQPVGPRWVVSERLPAPGRTEKRSAYRGPCTHDMYAYGSLLESSM
jgi:hypothetical protein